MPLILSTASTLRNNNSDLIVHEWGTLTSITDGNNGMPQDWIPLTDPIDLPDFVYHKTIRVCIKCDTYLVRMETPVLYFYSTQEQDVTVNVNFPTGKITEWYPQASSTDTGISWPNVHITPQTNALYPTDNSNNHYYVARETDASPIRIGSEYEKFLFYRGASLSKLPLTVLLESESNKVTIKSSEPISHMILFENKNGQIGWSNITNNQSHSRAELSNKSIESLQLELIKVLVSEGLYEKEATAMVNTWKSSWFEEGLRIIYILPRNIVDEILPITIKPVPKDLQRVFVSRLEIITPEMKQSIRAAVDQYSHGSQEERVLAMKTIIKYGRFAEPVLREMRMANNGDSPALTVYKQLINAK